MLVKLWQLKGVFVLLGLLVAFAACVKEKDPYLERNQIKDALGSITTAIANRDLSGLDQYFAKPIVEGAGPNRLVALLATDSGFVMYNRKFSIDEKKATVTFTRSSDPEDSVFSYLYMTYKDGWKIEKFDIH